MFSAEDDRGLRALTGALRVTTQSVEQGGKDRHERQGIAVREILCKRERLVHPFAGPIRVPEGPQDDAFIPVAHDARVRAIDKRQRAMLLRIV